MSTQMIGRYEVLGPLGRGGMATVLRAYDPSFRREVAIKILPSEFMHDPTFRERFEREARTVAALEHPAIVPVYDFGEEAGQPYLVMRLMTGGTLADRMRAGLIPLSVILHIFQRLAPALDEAHARGIVHRDLKPANILFDNRGEPHLADFGLAKLTEGSATLTGRTMVGTPTYISPEQARAESRIDGRSDIYAMGAILFQLLTDKPPYEADSPMGVVAKHLNEPVPRLRTLKPDWSEAFEALIQRAMAKEREARYPTAGALLEALTTAASQQRTQSAGTLRSSTHPTAEDDAVEAGTPIAPQRVNSRLWQLGTFLFAGLVVLVTLLFVVIGLINSSAPDPVLPTATNITHHAAITNIMVHDEVYVVDYSVSGYAPTTEGPHVHFFFNTISPEQAGAPNPDTWLEYTGPSPFTSYRVVDRPATATQICIVVANADHTVIPGSGNCMVLP